MIFKNSICHTIRIIKDDANIGLGRKTNNNKLLNRVYNMAVLPTRMRTPSVCVSLGASVERIILEKIIIERLELFRVCVEKNQNFIHPVPSKDFASMAIIVRNMK